MQINFCDCDCSMTNNYLLTCIKLINENFVKLLNYYTTIISHHFEIGLTLILV